MPIELPPPLPIEVVDATEVTASGAAYLSVAVKKYKVHIYSAPLIDKELLSQRLQSASRLADVMSALSEVYYSNGYPGSRIRYAVVDHDIYVQIAQKPVAHIAMPEPYASYFSSIKGRALLSDSALEPGRILASEFADRAGVNAQLNLEETPDGLSLGMQQSPSMGPALKFNAGFGNPGNRFLGRYFSSAAAALNTDTGDAFRASASNLIRGLDDQSEEATYGAYSLDWTRVTRLGIFGASGQTLRYGQSVQLNDTGAAIKLHGALDQAEISWATILAAGFDHRLGITLKIDYVAKRLTASDLSKTVQSQRYSSFEVGASDLRAVSFFEKDFQLTSTLSIRHGFALDADVLPQYVDLDYTLIRSSLQIESSKTEQGSVQIMVSGQYSKDIVPEQQQLVGGGIGTLDGFLPGAITGDSGAITRLQFDSKALHLGKFDIVPRYFVECVYAYLYPLSGSPAKRRVLSDTGVSLNFSYRPWISANISYAIPIFHAGYRSEEVADVQSDLVFFININF